MKVAVVYNRESKNVINLFGVPNREKIGTATIKRLVDALIAGGHQVKAFEGDKDLMTRLEGFMPRAIKGERPGMVFNVSYGIQGSARYTHVPSILEMVGIPYVGSDPLSHSLALDKVVTKMILRENGLPTPEFAVVTDPDAPEPGIGYPVIVKPKNEAVSFGIRVCNNLEELREGAKNILDGFDQAVLVERYIDGREVNVGLLGNNPPVALPPAELEFGTGQKIYTYEDKTHKSGRDVGVVCPAPLSPEKTAEAQDLAMRAFAAIGCRDCARVDMRMDAEGKLYILEINSLPSLGEHGSYTHAAAATGLDFAALCNRLVEVASIRYYGVAPPTLADAAQAALLEQVTRHRDDLERRIERLVDMPTPTGDVSGAQHMAAKVGKKLEEAGLKEVSAMSDGATTWSWATPKGMTGTLLVAAMDVPRTIDSGRQPFRRDPEWLAGQGIATAKAPIAVIENALSICRANKTLKNKRVGVVLYADEGQGATGSRRLLRAAFEGAERILVVSPGPAGGLVVRARGWRGMELIVDAPGQRPGEHGRGIMTRFMDAIHAARDAVKNVEGCTLSISSLSTRSHPRLLPHRVEASLVLTYRDSKSADLARDQLLKSVRSSRLRCRLVTQYDRPPMPQRDANNALASTLLRLAEPWEIPAARATTRLPCIAGLAPTSTPAVAGLGPLGRDLDRPEEAVSRLSLTQRSLLLAAFLATLE